MALAVGQFTIIDFNDVNISKTAPYRPVVDQLWLDSSVVPNQLKRWDGTKWVVVNDTTELEEAIVDADDKAQGVLDTVNELKDGSTETSIYSIIKQTKTVDGKPYFARTAEIETTIDNWTAKFEELSVGATNLFTMDSYSDYGVGTITKKDYTITVSGKNTGIKIDNSIYEPAAEHVLSFKFKKISGTVKSIGFHTGVMTKQTMYLDGNEVSLSGSGNFPDDTKEHQVVVYFTAKGGVLSDWDYIQPNRNDAYAYTYKAELYDIKLEKGNIATDWSPSPSELYTGITKIDKDGVTVGRSGSETRTELAHNGLNIYDGPNELASFGDIGAKIKEAKIDKLITTDAVLNFNRSIGCYVGNGKQYPNVSAVLTDLFYTKGEFRSHIVNDSRIDIYIQTDIQDNIAIYGIHGSGSIYIWFENGATLDGNIDVRDNTCRVYVRQRGGGHPRGKIKDDKSSWATIVNLNSAFLMLIGIDMDVNGNDYGIGGNDGGVTVIQDWDCSGAKVAAARALSGHSLRAFNSKGNAPTGFLAQRGGAVYLTGTTIRGSSKNYNDDLGYVITQGTLTPTDSAFNKPPLTNKTFTYEIPAKSLSTYNYTSGFVSSYYGNNAAQGRYTGMTGWMEGRVVFGTNVASKFAGATSIKTYVKLKRSKPGHGPSAAVKPKSYGFTATWATGATLGGWSSYAEVPSSLFTTSGDTTLKFRGTVMDSDYAIWEDAMVKVVVVKRV